MTDDSHALVADLHAALEATAERPVERDASRWLGEAEAVAGGAASGELSGATVRKRVEQVQHLLSEVDGTGDPAADEHVERARELVGEIEEEFRAETDLLDS